MKELTPKEQASNIIRKFETVIVEEIIASDAIFKYTARQCGIKYQEGIIEKLKFYGITHEYDLKVLSILKKNKS